MLPRLLASPPLLPRRGFCCFEAGNILSPCQGVKSPRVPAQIK